MAAYQVVLAYPGHYLYPGKGCTVVRRGLHISATASVYPCGHRPWDGETIR